ncbi:MAG: glycosyltransferase family 2 protein [Bacteroides sp.]|nr:glycosyltransferase family 2 protein [Bacteroides sp.]
MKQRIEKRGGKRLTLDVAICTYGREGIHRVASMLLPPQEEVSYVVSWQLHEGCLLPDSIATRSDVTVARLDVAGLSNNRNNAIAHCSSDLVLIADDDLKYYADSFSNVIKAFEDDPQMDLATFRVSFPNPKHYPGDGVELRNPLPKGYFVTSMEIAFRRLSAGDLRFNPMLGIGAPELLCGEEELFVNEAIKKGLRCRHIARNICDHASLTSGDKISKGIVMGQGYVIVHLYPVSGFPRLILKAYRMSKTKAIGFPTALYYLFKGALTRT